MGNTRTSRKKSRNGCIHCKRLRVKCDETKPQCDYCVRNGRKCEYTTQTMMGWPERQFAQMSLSTNHDKAIIKIEDIDIANLLASFAEPDSASSLLPHRPQPQSSNSSTRSPFDSITPIRGNWLHLSDLQLYFMDFFSRNGAVFLSVGESELTHFWRSNGLRVAVQSPVIMYSIIAYSQFFIGHPGINTGVGLGMTLTAASNISKSIANHTASPMELIIATKILAGTGFMDPVISIISFEGKVDLLGLCQGPRNILRTHSEHFEKAHLPFCEPLRHQRADRPDSQSEIITYLDKVFALCIELGLCIKEEEQCYVEALNTFADLIDKAYRMSSSWYIVMFVLGTSQEFLIFCRAKRPFALCIMLFFCSFIILANDNSVFWRKAFICAEEIRSLLPEQLVGVGNTAEKFIDGEEFEAEQVLVKELLKLSQTKMLAG
jgi:hypothetical protein